MKRLLPFFLALLLTLAGCNNTTPQPNTSSVPETPTDVSSDTPSGDEPITIDLPIHQLWTWNELYDFLENPRESGNLAFDEEQGESISLLDTDGVTSLSNQWNLPLEQNMLVIKYNRAGEIICKYRVNLTGETSSQDSPSRVPSTPSAVSRPSSDSPPSTPDQKQLLTIYIGQNDTLLEKAVGDFNKQSQRVELLPVKTSDTVTAQQLSQLVKENNCPDLVLMNHGEMMAAVSQKLLTNLSSLGMKQWKTRVDSSFLEQTTLGKGIYGLPLGAVTSCLACNDELLYRADANVPANLDELIENAKLLRDALPGVTPIGFTTDIADTASMAEEFALLLADNHGTLFTPDYTSSTFYSQAGINTLSLYQTLWNEKLISDYVVRKDFYSEKIGYGIVSSVDYAKTFGKQAKANYTAAPLVLGDSQPLSYMELYSFCIPSATSKEARKAAAEFLTFFYENADYSVDLCQKKGWVPALTKAREDQAYQTDEWQIFIDAAKTARMVPPLSCYPTIQTYLAECVSAVLSGTDADTALEKAWKKTENRLARG